ncbi:MAG: 23S rRNA (adenine(1618)-N(6))-methyltransferase RlmF [Cytophagaceae bacterium]|nr:23S rRNA (adenine(1618)-N(6))-methyltransferase RlmF [Cytophagaceae bacterium]MBL0324834.1 23S rRNA (adenine(1618)-N(6))-methyltransferase RlmF [Cytophagaceae bacterium]
MDVLINKKEKISFHPRNKHNGNYDFESLKKVVPDLESHVFTNVHGTQTIDFSDPVAVKMLNKALLYHYYKIPFWDIPAGYLCPPIPGRADYVHVVADILAESNAGLFPTGKAIKCLDIGVGANCIYPVLGHEEYGWSFVGSDIDPVSVKSAKAIVGFNPSLKGEIEIRHQVNSKHFFEGIILPEEYFQATFCNPPFYGSAEEALETNLKKQKNLKDKNIKHAVRNFGGNANELWYEGGELKFVLEMIRESQKFANNCLWFTTLVSKKENLERIKKEFEKLQILNIKIIEMSQGQKVSRVVAWSFS